MKKRIFTFLLAGLMAAGMVSCGSGPQSSTETSTETSTGGDSSASESSEQTGDSGEVISLDILSMPANKSGIIEGWWADDVREKLGIKFNLLPSGDQGEQKLQALMASGELPDLVIFKDYKQVENAVVGNMLLAFDDYKDLVPNVYANAAESLQYTADTLSDGQGKSFVVGTGIKHYPDSRGWSGLQVRYDLYKEIGSPEVGTLMDLVPVIQEMQALEPENADGKKVYGLSLFKDWDRSYMTVGMFAAGTMGYEIPGEGTLVQIDYRNDPNGVVDSLLVEDGVYMQFLDFCFALNQLDLPIVVLVNGQSASAAEVFTGALKDYGAAEVVGTATYGKGIVQNVIPLGDGSAVKITTAHYYTPSGFDLHGKGIEPLGV